MKNKEKVAGFIFGMLDRANGVVFFMLLPIIMSLFIIHYGVFRLNIPEDQIGSIAGANFAINITYLVFFKKLYDWAKSNKPRRTRNTPPVFADFTGDINIRPLGTTSIEPRMHFVRSSPTEDLKKQINGLEDKIRGLEEEIIALKLLHKPDPIANLNINNAITQMELKEE